MQKITTPPVATVCAVAAGLLAILALAQVLVPIPRPEALCILLLALAVLLPF